jgi:hypothetical protein
MTNPSQSSVKQSHATQSESLTGPASAPAKTQTHPRASVATEDDETLSDGVTLSPSSQASGEEGSPPTSEDVTEVDLIAEAAARLSITYINLST